MFCALHVDGRCCEKSHGIETIEAKYKKKKTRTALLIHIIMEVKGIALATITIRMFWVCTFVHVYRSVFVLFLFKPYYLHSCYYTF